MLVIGLALVALAVDLRRGVCHRPRSVWTWASGSPTWPQRGPPAVPGASASSSATIGLSWLATSILPVFEQAPQALLAIALLGFPGGRPRGVAAVVLAGLAVSIGLGVVAARFNVPLFLAIAAFCRWHARDARASQVGIPVSLQPQSRSSSRRHGDRRPRRSTVPSGSRPSHSCSSRSRSRSRPRSGLSRGVAHDSSTWSSAMSVRPALTASRSSSATFSKIGSCAWCAGTRRPRAMSMRRVSFIPSPDSSTVASDCR